MAGDDGGLSKGVGRVVGSVNYGQICLLTKVSVCSSFSTVS